jgi:hypothetical protein
VRFWRRDSPPETGQQFRVCSGCLAKVDADRYAHREDAPLHRDVSEIAGRDDGGREAAVP